MFGIGRAVETIESAIKQNTLAYNNLADEVYRANELKDVELEIRNRVDISLMEYMNLVNERDALIERVGHYETIFEGFKLPDDVRILPCSVNFEHCDDPCTMRRKYKLTFEADLCEIRRRGL